MDIKPEIIILSSGGFLGSALSKCFSNEGLATLKLVNSSELDLTHPGAHLHVDQLLNENTVLILTALARSRGDQYDTYSDNLVMYQNLARALGKTRIRKCVYFSSISVYGEQETNRSITEETLTAPSSIYGAGKLAAENLLKIASHEVGTPLVILRPCKIYGLGDRDFSSYGPAKFINSLIRENRVSLIGEGEEERDYLYIQDLIEMTKEIAYNQVVGVYNLATGISTSFKELASCIRKVTDRTFVVETIKRKRPVVHQQFNIRKLKKTMPNISFTDLEKGLSYIFGLKKC